MGWMLSSLEEIGLRKDLNVPSIESVLTWGFFKKIKAMKKQSKQSQKEKPFKKRKTPWTWLKQIYVFGWCPQVHTSCPKGTML